MNIHSPDITAELVAPHLIEQILAGEDAAGIVDQQFNQVELFCGEFYALIILICIAFRGIYGQDSGSNALCLCRFFLDVAVLINKFLVTDFLSTDDIKIFMIVK